VIQEVLNRPHAIPDDAVTALRDAGWHLLSDVIIEREDDPPIPDEHLDEAIRYSAEPSRPVRRTTLRAYLDDEIVDIVGTLHRESIAHSQFDVQALADADLGRHLLDAVGSRIGVPGAAERFAKERR
jgi:hypothetical protein